MRTWVLRALLALVVLVVSAVLVVWWLLRGSLPALDGELALSGLSAPVTVSRDADGVVTVDAQNETDAARALGYVHAQERYFEMDLMRRVPAGELSALFGARALEADRRNRVHRMRARVDAQLDAMAGERMAQLQAYTDGVNAGRAALRVRPWPYLLLRQTPAPWTTADSALTGFAMYFDLQDATNRNERALETARAHLPPALYALITHDGSTWDAPLFGPARGDAVLPGAAEVDLRRLPSPDTGSGHTPASDIASVRGARAWPPDATDTTRAARDLRPGSNNFAVSGALTADGRALVADDMHLGLRVPNIWFRARLRYPDARAPDGQVDVTGFTLPGLPAVIVGSTGHVAWGFTNSYGDYLDWQRVRPCAPGVTSGGECTPVVRHLEHIGIAGAEPVTLEVDETAWGPIVHREDDGQALALRWVAHLPGALNFALGDFPFAADLEAALAIADRTATPTQNLVIGDAQGRVAWRLLGPIPLRGAGCEGTTVSQPPNTTRDAAPVEAKTTPSPVAIAPGVDTGTPSNVCAPWTIATNASPRLGSPDTDRLWTANSRVVEGADFNRIGDGGAALGARAQQIRDVLQAGTRFTEADLLALQLDDRALLMTRWWQLLRERAPREGDSALRVLADAAGDWSGRADVDSTAYRLVRAWRLAVHERIADGLLAPARAATGDAFDMPALPQLEGVAWPLLQQRPAHLLPRRFACSADGACDTGAAGWEALLEDAARQVRDEFATTGPLAERRWGERNTAAICHPLASALPAIARGRLCMPADPLPGDSMMPRVQGPDFGASQRMVVAPGHETDGIAHMPGGQSGHPLSPYWGAGHDDWARGRASPFLPQTTVHTLRLLPAAAASR